MYEQLGRYRLTARIATGGMAEVFLARAEGVQGFARTVVIKRLLPHLAREPAVVEMFLNEARLTGRLDHANIVGVLDLGQANGHYFIAMEFLDGRALAEVRDAARAQGGMLPTGFVLKVMSDAMAGLHHAHEARAEDGTPLSVVHRDFNPDNISVTYDGRVKVLDFGIAKSQSAASSTEPGTLKGKYFYMSPEMVLGNPLDRRADIFAAGVTLYELCCDKRPFEGDTPNAILSGIAYGTPVPPRALNPTLPEALDALILGCMARAPDDRPPTALAVKEALDALLPQVGAFGPAEVAQLMALLFPPTDPERSRLNELRKIDPSLPDQARVPVAPAPPPAPQKPAKKPKPMVRPPRKPLPTARIAKVAGGLAIAGGLAFGAVKLRPEPTAAQAELRALEQAMEAHPKDAAPADAYARALVEAGRLDDALEVAGRVLGEHAHDVAAHVIQGDVYAHQRFGQKALEAYGQALADNPHDATALAHEDALHRALGHLSDAERDLAAALAQTPRDAHLALEVSDLQGRAGHWPAAIATLSAALEHAPQDAALRTQLGFASYQSGDDGKALRELTAVERAHPDSPKAELYLGFVYYRQGKTDKALESYRRAAAHAKDQPALAAQAYNARGQIALAQGDTAAAKKAFTAAVKADPTLAEAASALKKLR